MRVILLIPALGLLGLLAVIIGYPFSLPSDEAIMARLSLDLSSQEVAQGKYLAVAGNCASCHTTVEGQLMAGGVPFETPYGRIYSTNITPDSATGLGDWTLPDFVRAMRHGVGDAGEHLYPVFPYPHFAQMTDSDVAALFAYLKSLPPVSSSPPENALMFPFSQRRLLAAWKLLYLKSERFQPSQAQSTQWNRGAYLVNAVAHCGACHAPRNALGATASSMSGGTYRDKIPGGELRTWSTPGLTNDTMGLAYWSHAELVSYLKTGVNRYVDTFGPMNKVIMSSTRRLTEQDIDAMAVYLKSLPPNLSPVAAKPNKQVMGMGKTLYSLYCGTCHLPTGLGDPEMGPQLAQGSLVVRAKDPAGLINVILYGPESPDEPLPSQRRDPMEAFQYELDDHEVAALASYVRASWGNGAGPVTPKQVAQQR